MVARAARLNRPPRVPGDLEYDQCDHQSDNRVCDSQPERHDRSARDYSERDESVDACVITVRDQRGAVEAPAAPKPDLSGDLVPDEADDTRRRQRPQV